MGQEKCIKCSRFLSSDGVCSSKKCDLLNISATFTLVQEGRLLNMIRKVIQEELQPLKDQLQETLRKNETLHAQNKNLKTQVNDLEQYTRRNNVVLTGVPETAEENIHEVVKKCGKSVGVLIHEKDIDVVHRMPAKNPTCKAALIIVKFTRRIFKQKFVSRWRMKKPTSRALGFEEEYKVFVSYHLSPANAMLFHKAFMQRENKIEFVWTRL